MNRDRLCYLISMFMERGFPKLQDYQNARTEILDAFDALLNKNKALGEWKCYDCGCRFNKQMTGPTGIQDGIARCSSCAALDGDRITHYKALKLLSEALETPIEDISLLGAIRALTKKSDSE